jgi:hypothetical protein
VKWRSETIPKGYHVLKWTVKWLAVETVARDRSCQNFPSVFIV